MLRRRTSGVDVSLLGPAVWWMAIFFLTASLSEHYAQAAVIAESKLAEVGTVLPLEEGETGGEEQIYRWQVDIAPHQWPAEDLDPAFPVDSFAPFHIRVNVSWLQGAKPQFITIESLQIKVK